MANGDERNDLRTNGGEIFALIFGLLLPCRTIQVPAEPAKGSHGSACRPPADASSPLFPPVLREETEETPAHDKNGFYLLAVMRRSSGACSTSRPSGEISKRKTACSSSRNRAS